MLKTNLKSLSVSGFNDLHIISGSERMKSERAAGKKRKAG